MRLNGAKDAKTGDSSSKGLANVSLRFLRAMSEIWSDRLPMPSEIFLSTSLLIGSHQLRTEGFAVIPFQLTIEDDKDYSISLLVPFEALEAHEESLMPRTILNLQRKALAHGSLK